MAAGLTGRLVRRPEIQQAVEDAVRAALARRTATLLDRVAAGARGMDARLEAAPRRWARRPPRRIAVIRSGRGAYAGLASRIGAFLVDLVAVHAVFLIGDATVGLVLALANGTPSHLLAEAIATAGWLAVLAAYFVGFWATAGQTPGMALLGMRLVVLKAAPLAGAGRSYAWPAGSWRSRSSSSGSCRCLSTTGAVHCRTSLPVPRSSTSPLRLAIQGTPEVSSTMLPA